MVFESFLQADYTTVSAKVRNVSQFGNRAHGHYFQELGRISPIQTKKSTLINFKPTRW